MFYLDANGIVVEDLQSKGAKLWLLYVPREHIRTGHETPAMKREAKERLKEVAGWLREEGGYEIGSWNDTDFQYPDHWARAT